MAEIAPVLKHRFFDDDGNPLVGGKLYSYIANTTTPKATYTDESGVTPATNPIILDSAGYCELFLGAGTYKFILTDSEDNQIFTADDVSLPAGRTDSAVQAEYDFAITDGQSATSLSGQIFDGAAYTSVVFDAEIIRGTSVFANLRFAMQYKDSTWRLVTGASLSEELHGVTFSVSQTGSSGQLQAALDSGAGSGTLKLKRSPYGA